MIPISLPLVLISLSALLAFFLLIMAALGASRSKPTSDPDNDPRCGACGCIIPDPQQHICSTCGSSLSAVGLVLPFSKRRTTSWTGRQAFFKITALPLALWTIFIVGAGIGANFAVDQWLLPYVWRTTSSVQARPRSRGCESIMISTLEEYRARGHAQLETPSGIRTSQLELKTETGSHLLYVDLLAPSFTITDATGQPATQNHLPTKSEVLAFMRASGIPLSPAAAQEAGIIAAMLGDFTPQKTAIISHNPRLASAPTLDAKQITFSGGQWKTPLPLTPIATYSSAALWLLGFILIIWRGRRRRAELCADLLKPPMPALSPLETALADEDAGGWDITLDPNAIPTGNPPAQLSAPRSAFKSSPQPVNLKNR